MDSGLPSRIGKEEPEASDSELQQAGFLMRAPRLPYPPPPLGKLPSFIKVFATPFTTTALKNEVQSGAAKVKENINNELKYRNPRLFDGLINEAVNRHLRKY